jgi:ABC-type amino acid transport substrate-binding protein
MKKLLLLLLLIPFSLFAQDKKDIIRAGISESSPFVINKKNADNVLTNFGSIYQLKNKETDYYGMAIDLWELMEPFFTEETEYIYYDEPDDLVKALQNGEIDIIVENLTMTSTRAAKVNFTHPWYNGGLRIMANVGHEESVWEILDRKGYLKLGSMFAGAILILTIAVVIWRRKYSKNFPPRFIDQFAFSFKDVIQALQSGRIGIKEGVYPKSWIWNIIAALWTLIGVSLIAYITSTVTMAMTTSSLQVKTISSIQELKGSSIGTFPGTTADSYLQYVGFEDIKYYFTEKEFYDALIKKEIMAFVGDAPVLEYLANKYPNKDIAIVGELFNRERYAFAAKDPEFTIRMNKKIIEFYEDGTLDLLRQQYFGSDN